MKKFACTLLFWVFFQQAFSQSNIDFLGHYSFPYRTSNLWSYESSGKQYALVGTETGFAIIDITSPATPVLIDSVVGATSIWREVKIWQHYAYVVTEGSGGLLVVDLSTLPTSISYYFTDCGVGLRTAHALHVDEYGYLYLYGSQNDIGNGTLIFDLNSDPSNPLLIGSYTANYIHDGEVRNNTIYASEIYNGTATLIDVSNKTTPTVIGSINTPSNFTHNTWLSDDGTVMYTTDERSAAYVAAYDITDPSDINELCRWKNYEGSAAIPHNVYVKNDYLVLSEYRDGVYIIDGHRPSNLVTVGHYDTSPYESGAGFNGAWGVCPYFSDDKIIVSDIETGLYILDVHYTRACYLEGTLSDQNGTPIIGAQCDILSDPASTRRSSISGSYATGTVDSGLVDVRFYTPTCLTKIVTNVHLEKGIITHLDATLECSTDIVEASQNTISIYPSVTDNIIHIQNPDASNMRIQLFDAEGKLVKTYSSDTPLTELSLQGFSPGAYILKINNQQKILSQKIILH